MEDPEQLTRDIGRRIAELRRARGLTQQEFAEMAGVSVQWVSRVELGQENVTVHTLSKIANVLGARVADLFQPPGPATQEVRRGRPRKP